MSADTDTAVTVRHSGPTVALEGPAAQLLARLAVGRLEVTGTGPSCATAPVSLALVAVRREWPTGTVRARLWAGLLPVVRGLAAELGVPLTETGGETDAHAGRPRTPIGDPAVTDPAVVAFAATARRGLVRYAERTVDPLDLVAQVCAGLSGARIVALVRTRRDASELVDLLRRRGVDAAATVPGTVPERRPRVTVTLLGQMGALRLAAADLVLVADALDGTWDDPLTAPPLADPNAPGAPRGQRPVGLLERLVDAGDATVIGLLPLGRVPSPFERARLWQLYGLAELVVPAPGRVERRVAVAAVKCHTAAPHSTGPAAAQNAVRMSPVRNRRVAAVARALRAGDADELGRLAPGSGLAALGTGPRHVLLLAENLKQAEALRRHLPGWALVSGLGDDPGVAEPGAPRGVIATALGIDALAGSEYDAVVRADPGDGLPPLPPGWLSAPQADARPLLLVDVTDRGCAPAAHWSRSRRRAHRSAGWVLLDESPDTTAWLRYCAEVLARMRCR